MQITGGSMDHKTLTTGKLHSHLAMLVGAVLCVALTNSQLKAESPSVPPDPDQNQAREIQQIQHTGENRDGRSGKSIPSGTSSDQAKRAAIASLPLNQLKPADRQRVTNVVDSISIFRRLPTVVFASDPEAYEYFIFHPDVAISIWRAMNISKLQMWQTGRFEYEGDARDGTVGTLDVLHQSPHQNLIVCEGEFKSPLIAKPIRAVAVIHLHTSYLKDADEVIYVKHKADLFVSFPSLAVDNIAKILSPLSGRIADKTFSEISLFLKMMAMAMGKRPGWVEKIVDKMDGIPELRRKQLLQLTANIYAAELKRQGRTPWDAADKPQRTQPNSPRNNLKLATPVPRTRSNR